MNFLKLPAPSSGIEAHTPGLWDTEDETQGLAHALSALFHLSYIYSSEASFYYQRCSLGVGVEKEEELSFSE